MLVTLRGQRGKASITQEKKICRNHCWIKKFKKKRSFSQQEAQQPSGRWILLTLPGSQPCSSDMSPQS